MTKRTGRVSGLSATASLSDNNQYNVQVKGDITLPTPSHATQVTMTAVGGGKLKVFLKLQRAAPEDEDTGPGLEIEVLDTCTFAHAVEIPAEKRPKQLELTVEGHPPIHAAITYPA